MSETCNCDQYICLHVFFALGRDAQERIALCTVDTVAARSVRNAPPEHGYNMHPLREVYAGRVTTPTNTHTQVVAGRHLCTVWACRFFENARVHSLLQSKS